MSKDLDNPNAMTGRGFMFHIDYDRGFYSTETIGSIDAPAFVVAGSAVENCQGNDRYVISNITMRVGV